MENNENINITYQVTDTQLREDPEISPDHRNFTAGVLCELRGILMYMEALNAPIFLLGIR